MIDSGDGSETLSDDDSGPVFPDTPEFLAVVSGNPELADSELVGSESDSSPVSSKLERPLLQFIRLRCVGVGSLPRERIKSMTLPIPPC